MTNAYQTKPQMNADERKYAPQRTLRTQSPVLSNFAVFAPFAVSSINELGVWTK